MSKQQNVRKTIPNEHKMYQPRLDARQPAIDHRRGLAAGHWRVLSAVLALLSFLEGVPLVSNLTLVETVSKDEKRVTFGWWNVGTGSRTSWAKINNKSIDPEGTNEDFACGGIYHKRAYGQECMVFDVQKLGSVRASLVHKQVAANTRFLLNFHVQTEEETKSKYEKRVALRWLNGGGQAKKEAMGSPKSHSRCASGDLFYRGSRRLRRAPKGVFGDDDINRTTSPTAEERIAIEALTDSHRVQLPHAREPSDAHTSDSILELAQMLTSPSAASELNLAAAATHSASGILNEPDVDQVVELNLRRSVTPPLVVSYEMRPSCSIPTGAHPAAQPEFQSPGTLEETVRAQMMELNDGFCTASPTAVEMQQWLDLGRDLGQHSVWMSSAREAAVQLWCNAVARSSRVPERNISQSGWNESLRDEQSFHNYHF
ncbi:hypothetical protein C8J57DRAFT_1239565 [Mycena rebaudengoi]|nr:hypothetical protein C8J57DRAFT_1239565 [Mycena rebaudengoi]